MVEALKSQRNELSDNNVKGQTVIAQYSTDLAYTSTFLYIYFSCALF